MQYWYLWLIFIVVCALTVFMFRKASAAADVRSKSREEAMAELKRLKEMKDKYKQASAELVQSAEPSELLEGANAVLQAKVEKAENAEDCFLQFTKPQQYMYTLQYFLEDSTERPEFFLRNNGEPLLSTAAPALEAIGETEIAKALFTYFKDRKEKGDTLTDEALQIAYSHAVTPIFSKVRMLENAKNYMISHREEIFF